MIVHAKGSDGWFDFCRRVVMRGRVTVLIVSLIVTMLAVASCYDPKDPTLPPAYPDYPSRALDGGRG